MHLDVPQIAINIYLFQEKMVILFSVLRVAQELETHLHDGGECRPRKHDLELVSFVYGLLLCNVFDGFDKSLGPFRYFRKIEELMGQSVTTYLRLRILRIRSLSLALESLQFRFG